MDGQKRCKKQTEFGFARINFGYDKSVPDFLAQHPAMKTELSLAVRAEIARAKQPNCIDAARLRMLGLV
jgi:hypothetical protein